MEDCLKKIGVRTDNYSKIKERAAFLAGSINEAKERGVSVNPNEPIEGKMFWTGNM